MLTVFSGRIRKHCHFTFQCGQECEPSAGEIIIPVGQQYMELLSVSYRHVLTGREQTVSLSVILSCGFAGAHTDIINSEKQQAGDRSVTHHACITVCIQAVFEVGCRVWLYTWLPALGLVLVQKKSHEKEGIVLASTAPPQVICMKSFSKINKQNQFIQSEKGL